MTIPHLSNCNHKDDGWCLACVKALNEEKEHYRDLLNPAIFVKEPTHDLRIRVARLRGWRPMQANDGTIWGYTLSNNAVNTYPPEYAKSYDAIHEVEMWLRSKEGRYECGGLFTFPAYCWRLMQLYGPCATPEERCKVLLEIYVDNVWVWTESEDKGNYWYNEVIDEKFYGEESPRLP